MNAAHPRKDGRADFILHPSFFILPAKHSPWLIRFIIDGEERQTGQGFPLAALFRDRRGGTDSVRSDARLRRLQLHGHHQEVRLERPVGSSEPHLLGCDADRSRHVVSARSSRGQAQSRRLSRGEGRGEESRRIPLRRRGSRSLPAELHVSRHGVSRDGRSRGDEWLARCAARPPF